MDAWDAASSVGGAVGAGEHPEVAAATPPSTPMSAASPASARQPAESSAPKTGDQAKARGGSFQGVRESQSEEEDPRCGAAPAESRAAASRPRGGQGPRIPSCVAFLAAASHLLKLCAMSIGCRITCDRFCCSAVCHGGKGGEASVGGVRAGGMGLALLLRSCGPR